MSPVRMCVMALTQSIEANSKLIDYLTYIGVKLSSSDSTEVSAQQNTDVDIAELFGQMLAHANTHGLFITRPALQYTLEKISESIAELNSEALTSLVGALTAYLESQDLEKHTEVIVSFLPKALAGEYAEMLLDEAALLSDGLPALADDEEFISPLAVASANELTAPENEVGPTDLSPLQAALELAIEAFHALLESESTLPDLTKLQSLLQEQLSHLETVARNAGADAFLDGLADLQAWAGALEAQEQEPGAFISDVLIKLAALPFDATSDAEEQVHASEAFSDERLGMLHEELCDFDEQLTQQALVLTEEDTEGETLIEVIESYSELLNRMVSACNALGLLGLERVCNFVIENVNLLPTLAPTDRLAARPVLSRWPAMVKHYLVDPADDAGLMGLIDLLQQTAWPNRLDGLDSRDLYAELSRGAAEEDDTVSETLRPTHASTDDVSLEVSADTNPQLLEAFLVEAPDVAVRFNQVISTLDTAANPFEGMRSAQRLSHTLKGSANLIGVKGIANLAHHIEDILDTLTRRHQAPSRALISVLHEASDCLESMIDTVAGRDSAPQNALPILQQILDLANLVDSGEYAVDAPLSFSENVTANPAEKEAAPPSPTTSTASETIRVPTATVDAMFRLVEEITISLAQVNEHVSRLKLRSESLNLHDRSLQQRRFDLENLVDVRGIAAMQKRLNRVIDSVNKFDPLEMDQYDELHSATHSYIEAVADAREISNELHDGILALDGFLLRQSRLNKELQQLVSATRMVPVSDISNRLQRAVRQASRATGHAAELVIQDHNLMMDGDVLNKLVDPLMHILRNAVDHGMGPAEQSEETGLITVRFIQEGSNVVIRCADNGKGLDYTRIREVAIERGILRPEQELSNEELARFIMSPAFTTRNTTTQVSGRGIGMDAVFTTISELKGTISVHDVVPHGTEFVIRLPLSLVTTHSLVVQSGDAVYAIPSTTLSQILSPGTGIISPRDDGYTYRLEREVYAMYPLTTLLGYESDTAPESATMLLTGRGASPAAIAVDAVMQSSELVIKRLGRYVPKVTGIAGITVLGDGRVIPVLDLPELLLSVQDGAVNTSSLQTATGSQQLRQGAGKPTALVVDDSLSARNSLSQLLEDSGYKVLTARDGLEAIELLQEEIPLVVLADLEMPRMDGIELTRHIRSSQQLQQLPVVMITSRSQNKHRQEAEMAGVSAYLTKPFMDDEVIDIVASLV